MKQKNISWLILVPLIYIGFIIYNAGKDENKIENPEYQQYIDDYRNIVNQKVLETIDKQESGNEYKFEYKNHSSGTSSNFEGPQVHLKGIKFFDEYLSSADEGKRLIHFDPLSAQFDPDHPYFGLPDVKISIKDVRLYKIEKGPLADLLTLGMSNEPKPYKIYKKRMVSDSTNLKSKYFVMQLWLTEFDVTVAIRPDLDIPLSPGNDELENTQYPGYWYGSAQKYVKLKDMDKEYKDFRYGDLSFILEIIPDNSPVYVKTPQGQTSKADFAIGALYCKNAIIGNEPNVQRISTNIHAGQPVFLNYENEYEKMNQNIFNLPSNLEASAQKLLDMKLKNENYIWNKHYFVKLFFNNLGTWRSGLFNQNQYHDQVSYSFLMPVFVVGSWDVIVPQDVLPAWNPPPAYIRKFGLKSLLPFWKSGIIGKLAGISLLLFSAFFVISFIFPGIIPLVKKLFHST